jgi:hypothetical protein
LELARQGAPKAPFYLTGQVGGQPFSVHAEGERVILTGADGRREIDLVPPLAPAPPALLPEPVCPTAEVHSLADEGHEQPSAPGTSPLDPSWSPLRPASPAEEGGAS